MTTQDETGAIVDSLTLQKALRLGLDPQVYLESNDSYNFFSNIGDALITGLTGANVSDLVVCLKE